MRTHAVDWSKAALRGDAEPFAVGGGCGCGGAAEGRRAPTRQGSEQAPWEGGVDWSKAALRGDAGSVGKQGGAKAAAPPPAQKDRPAGRRRPLPGKAPPWEQGVDWSKAALKGGAQVPRPAPAPPGEQKGKRPPDHDVRPPWEQGADWATAAIGVGRVPGSSLVKDDSVTRSQTCNFLVDIAVRGKHLGDFDAVDDEVRALMRSQRVPNAALAIMAPDGRLVLAHGYTYCDAFPPDGGIADESDGSSGFEVYYAEPTSRFRLGSISKLLTAATVLSLHEERAFGVDGLDSPVTNFMGYTWFKRKWDGSGGLVRDGDAYRSETTIRDLLRHHDPWCERADENNFDDAQLASLVMNGIDCDPGKNPMRQDAEIAEANGWAFGLPIDRDAIRAYMNGIPSNFAPGTVYGYSNYGYMLLSQIIEKVTGKDYESVVRQRVLSPLGMRRTRVGRSKHRDRLDGEVEYYDWDFQPTTGDVANADGYVRSVVHDAATDADRPWAYKPYGYFNMANQRGPGGWTSTVVDLARLAKDLWLGGALGTSSYILSQTTIDDMITTSTNYLYPSGGDPGVGDSENGMGMYAEAIGTADGRLYVGGTLPSGSKTTMQTFDDGSGNWWTFVLLFNKTLKKDGDAWFGGSTVTRVFLEHLTDALKTLIPTLTEAGTQDLFDDYTDGFSPDDIGFGFGTSRWGRPRVDPLDLP